ncbi:MAG TPA: tetratricopeptide repeat protein, partial [Syntrophales bacterium]|nr:tetratricopeptide repeat protein [Syntrophales bacterium]
MVRLIFVLQILLVWVSVSFAQDVASDARRHLVRGIAAVEMAKSDADLALAVDEFRKATVIAPNLAEAWFNLGRVQAKMVDYAGSINSYKRYLVLAPSGADADKVRDEIIKMEFKNEQAEKVKSRAGVWIAEDGAIYRLTLDGNRMTLVTGGHYVTDAEVTSTYSLVGGIPVRKFVALRYNLEFQGSKVSGTWTRTAFTVEKCAIPEDGGDVSGELKDSDRMLTLRHTRTKYRASTTMGILTDDSCGEVVAVEKKAI